MDEQVDIRGRKDNWTSRHWIYANGGEVFQGWQSPADAHYVVGMISASFMTSDEMAEAKARRFAREAGMIAETRASVETELRGIPRSGVGMFDLRGSPL